MAQTHLDMTRKIAVLFAKLMLKVNNPAAVYRGKVAAGNYFTVLVPPKDNPLGEREVITLVVDKTCQLVEMFVGGATREDIQSGHSKFGDYAVKKDMTGFIQAPIIN